MRYAAALLVLGLVACQPQSGRLLLLDLALSDPIVLDATAAPWDAAGYSVEYRRYYPHLTRQDLAQYRVVVVLGGREPEASSDALTIGDLAILTEWLRQGGVVVFGYAADGEGFLDRWVMNRWLAALGTGLVIGDFPLEDSVQARGAQPLVYPLPHSALDDAGFEPFSAGRNHVVLVRRESQVLARSGPTAFVRPPREAPAPRHGAAVVAAARVGEGLVVVVSRSALAGGSPDLLNNAARSREFLNALARWTRRPAEWASVAPAAGHVPLVLSGAPHPVAGHAPPLVPPVTGGDTAFVVLPLARPTPPPDARAGVPNWIGRQGMRVVWARALPPQRALDTLLSFVDAGALNVLATEVFAPARSDSLGLRNIWRATAARLQATSLRWFPAIALDDLRPEGEAAAGITREVDVHGDTVAMWCGLDSLFWRGALRPAYRALARLGGDKGADLVAGVALDLDMAKGGYGAAGFCDATYREGVRALGLDSTATERFLGLPAAAGARYDALLESGLLGRYQQTLEGLVAQRAAALRVELRRLNPELSFAFRSAQVPTDWFSLGLLRGFSGGDTPVYLWTREPRVRDLLAHYRARGIFALSAVGLAPERVATGDWPRLRRAVFVEHSGFWVPWGDVPGFRTAQSDSVGRLMRRLAR